MASKKLPALPSARVTIVIIMLATLFICTGTGFSATEAISNSLSAKSAQTDPLEYLHQGEAYEADGKYDKAVESYRNMIELLNVKLNKAADDITVMMLEDFIVSLNFRIDAISLEKLKLKGYKPVVGRLKLSSANVSLIVAPIVGVFIAPRDYAGSTENIAGYISNSPSNFSSSIIAFGGMVTNASNNISSNDLKDSEGASIEDVLRASEVYFEQYTNKYPDSYQALVLKILYQDYYRRNGQSNKADVLKKEITAVSKQRGMEIYTDADPRFADPEDTWATFIGALEAGNIETIMECHMPGQIKKGELYIALGKEKMKEIAMGMKKSKLLAKSDSKNKVIAEYTLLKDEGGSLYAFDVIFVNVGGEWRLLKF